MSNRKLFIDFIQSEIFNKESTYIEKNPNNWEEIKQYWKEFCSAPVASKLEITENGKKILRYMQEQESNNFKAKDIAEGIFASSRAVSGSMPKLIAEGFVEKNGTNPVIYSLTDKGKNKELK